MTVAELIRHLQKMPQDAMVTMSNNIYIINGEYEVTDVETFDCKTVEICTDYKNRVRNYEMDLYKDVREKLGYKICRRL